MSYATIIHKIKSKNIKMLFDSNGIWTGRCEMPAGDMPEPFLTQLELDQMKTITEKIWNGK